MQTLLRCEQALNNWHGYNAHKHVSMQKKWHEIGLNDWHNETQRSTLITTATLLHTAMEIAN